MTNLVSIEFCTIHSRVVPTVLSKQGWLNFKEISALRPSIPSFWSYPGDLELR